MITARTGRTEWEFKDLPPQSGKEGIVASLLDRMGGRYASALDINLAGGASSELFKWFLASVLFGVRIGEGIAMKTYREFEKAGALSARAILDTGWQGLVDILDRGGYVRYDFKTATKLLEIMRALEEKYHGDLNRLHSAAKDETDLEQRLQDLGKGIGPVTANIFLRELRDVWEKAKPRLSEPALLAARNLGLAERTTPDLVLGELQLIWKASARKGSFADFEAALVRLGKNFCGKGKCSSCPMKPECSHGESG